jgi:hypothetical protein
MGNFLFTTTFRPALGPTQPPIQWAPGALPLGVKRPGRDVDHSPPFSAKVENALSYTSTSPLWRDAQLKHRDNFTLPFYFYKSFENDIWLNTCHE